MVKTPRRQTGERKRTPGPRAITLRMPVDLLRRVDDAVRQLNRHRAGPRWNRTTLILFALRRLEQDGLPKPVRDDRND